VICGLKGCYRKLSRPIWCDMRIWTEDRGLCLDLIWGYMWIGTDDIKCWIYQLYIAISIGKNVTGSFHEQFEVLCGLEQMIKDDVMT
jgi:hypothetical protein